MRHAKLSASGSSRWLNCPGSIKLEEPFPDNTSAFAEEGTLAHELGEKKLRHYFYGNFIDRSEIKKSEYYSAEMESYTDEYLEYVKSVANNLDRTPIAYLEKHVNFCHVVPDGFGTADCILFLGTELHIIDLKYGKGVKVDAKNNTQLQLYALGAINYFDFILKPEKIIMHIVQPRLGHFDSWEISRSQLMQFADYVRPIAVRAYEGTDEIKQGDWCKFCKAKNICRARSEYFTELIPLTDKKPATLSNAEIGQILKRSEGLVDWYNSMKDYALSQVLAGHEIEGWKAVEGRSVRKWTDQDTAFSTLIKSGINEEMLYEKKALSLSAIEKMLGKKEFKEIVGEFINKAPGKPTLVDESDKSEKITIFENLEV